jgi:hypothetical protein
MPWCSARHCTHSSTSFLALLGIALPVTSYPPSSRAWPERSGAESKGAATAQPWRSRGTREFASRENRKSWINRALRHTRSFCHGAIWFDFAPLLSAALTMTVSHPKQCCPRAKLHAQNDEPRPLLIQGNRHATPPGIAGPEKAFARPPGNMNTAKEEVFTVPNFVIGILPDQFIQFVW